MERALDLADGRNTIEADLPPATFGRVRYEVAVDAQGDTIRQNNRDGVTIDVLAAPDVLIVTPQAAWAEVLVKSGVPFRQAHETVGRQVLEGTLKVPWNARVSLAKRDVVGAPHPRRVTGRATAVRREAAALIRWTKGHPPRLPS